MPESQAALALEHIDIGRRAEPIPHDVLRAHPWRAARDGLAVDNPK